MEKHIKYIMVILLGGTLYGMIEILYRGHTHWSMIITGGFATLSLYIIYNNAHDLSIILKSILGCLSITLLEYSSGIILNKIFAFNVWNYENLPFNISGQISLSFSFGWFILSMLFFILADKTNLKQKF